MQSLEVFSVNLWQILISLCNLTILFLLLKKFLYKPVQKVLEERKAALDKQYEDAKQAQQSAERDKALYAEKLRDARAEADGVIRKATESAEARGEEIIASAKERADGMIKQAQAEIYLEQNKAKAQMRREIADVSVKIAGQLLDREISAKDHSKLIDSFLDEVGEDK